MRYKTHFVIFTIALCVILLQGQEIWGAGYLAQHNPKPTAVGGWPTPNPAGTPEVVEVVRAVEALTPVSPPPLPTRIPDYTPPVTHLELSGEHNGQGWYRTPVTVTFVATDDMTWLGITEYKINESSEWAQREYYYPPVVVHNEGVHTITYRSIDKLFNIEAVKTDTINIDLTSPVVTATLKGWQLPNGWYNSPVTVTLSGQDKLSDIAVQQLQLNNTGWLTTTSPTVISQTGRYTLAWRALDRAGNRSAEKRITLDVDLTPPTTTHHFSGAVAANGWYRTPVTVTLISTDTGAGVFQILYRLDGGPAWQIYGGSFVIDDDGSHTLEYYATDRANNSETAHSAGFDIDLTAPASSYPALEGEIGSKGWYISPLTITLKAVDGQAGVARIEYDWRGSGWLTYTAPLTAADEGVHQLAYRAVDETGHVEATQYFTAMLDFSPPELNIQPVPVMTFSTIILSDIYTASDSVSGIDALTATIGGQEVQTGQGVPLGTNTLIVTATNGAGLQSMGSQTIVVNGVKLYLPLIIKPVCEWGWPYCW